MLTDLTQIGLSYTKYFDDIGFIGFPNPDPNAKNSKKKILEVVLKGISINGLLLSVPINN